jgi:hypothetical protein
LIAVLIQLDGDNLSKRETVAQNDTAIQLDERTTTSTHSDRYRRTHTELPSLARRLPDRALVIRLIHLLHQLLLDLLIPKPSRRTMHEREWNMSNRRLRLWGLAS